MRILVLIASVVIAAISPAHGASKKALILGINGQDGYFLARLLVKKGYHVHASMRKRDEAFEKLFEGTSITFHEGDIIDAPYMRGLIETIEPDEVYNLAGQSHVGLSFKKPAMTGQANGFALHNILEPLLDLNAKQKTRFFQASTSQIFGTPSEAGHEHALFDPQSPYAISKLYAHLLTKLYRTAYGLFACNGILYNHESERRGAEFVSQKIVEHAAGWAVGKRDVLKLGSLDVQRDWGYAPDYVEGMWLMLQHDMPDDYVLATEHPHSIRQFVERAFAYTGITLSWAGSGKDEVGKNTHTDEVVVVIDPAFVRPHEPALLIGNAGKAKEVLSWQPRTSFEELVDLMMRAQLRKYGVMPLEAQDTLLLANNGTASRT